jgi:hypothetical protein
MCVLLVGNKADGANTRQVTTEEAIEFAKSSNLDYIECSAKDNINTEVAFRRPVLLAASFFPEIQDSLVLTGLPDGYMVINDVNDVSKSSYCNYWLNEKQATIPTTSASTGLLYEADKVFFYSLICVLLTLIVYFRLILRHRLIPLGHPAVDNILYFQIIVLTHSLTHSLT